MVRPTLKLALLEHNLNSEKFLGKWYALDANRYYQILGKPISYYKMYVHTVSDTHFWYDSFIQFEGGSVQALKVDKESEIASLKHEIDLGYLSRVKSDMRPSLNDIGRKYGLDIRMQVS